MQSNSKANRILCSDAAYRLLVEQAPDIAIKRRGKIAVKGKGEMKRHWIGDQPENNNDTKPEQHPLSAKQKFDESKRVGFDSKDVDDVEQIKASLAEKSIAKNKAD